jgi:hypothetical protein
MLSALDAIAERGAITIVETIGGNGASLVTASDVESYLVDYNPTRVTAWDDRPPVVGLYHELAHVYDFGHGIVAGGVYQGQDEPQPVPNLERVATGLPIHDRDGDGVAESLDERHPEELTENALRDELGLAPRTAYTRAPGTA